MPPHTHIHIQVFKNQDKNADLKERGKKKIMREIKSTQRWSTWCGIKMYGGKFQSNQKRWILDKVKETQRWHHYHHLDVGSMPFDFSFAGCIPPSTLLHIKLIQSANCRHFTYLKSKLNKNDSAASMNVICGGRISLLLFLFYFLFFFLHTARLFFFCFLLLFLLSLAFIPSHVLEIIQ